MRSLQPVAVLLVCTLLGVIVGAVLGTRVHVDVRVDAKVEDRAPPAPVDWGAPFRFPVTGQGRDVHLDEGDLESLDSAALGRALLHRDANGEVDGYRVSAVRLGTLPAKLGLADGDVVHAVNGRELRSVDDALAVVGLLKSEDFFTVDYSRDGEPRTVNLWVAHSAVTMR
ncbi:MAG: hypothetical protein R3F61_07745 [Myxococcota bacterium]